jgi:putative inorganic carbon (HCO3(-)) transporter
MLSQAASVVDRYYLVVVLAAAPFLLFPSALGTLALLLVPLPWIAAWIVRGQPIPRTPFDAMLLVLSLMVLVSVYATSSLAFSLPKVTGVLLGVATFYALVRWVNSPSRLWLAIQLFMLAGAGLGGLALLGTNWYSKFPVLDQVVNYLPRVIRGLPGAEEGFQPNAVGGALLFFLPLQVISLAASGDPEQALCRPAWLSRRLHSIVQLLLLAFTGSILLLSQSRGAWLGLGAGLVAHLCWHSARSRRWLALLLAVVLIAVVVADARSVWALMNLQTGPVLEVQLAGRLELWSTALHAIQEFPVTGVGMNGFRRLMPVLYPAYLLESDFDVAHPHNHFLTVALDLGVPGLIAYVALWLGAVRLLVFARRQSQVAWLRSAAEGLGAGLLAHFIFGATDAIALGAKLGIIFFVVLALAVALFQAAHAQPRASQGSRPAQRAWPGVRAVTG